ncbi:LacI family DNA-binding transcriptional regulator [Vibrio parahaemolyticus]|uniref:LacI family DNA-binding transcriptional regulator n=1 Tax=Vibrio parahaemolyticus TaxID=670 RepID=A0AA46UIY8_VIBPH|nr:LacI family DNA-binding transcriptional regulator [Vibrio parahaemolyticus]EGR1736127.1 LacI family DNA-binding transcriptional regulator [Vibrio parahaemolyticus]EGX7687673.1 LacI family DNA-binding transcriptional regulator [Vibrio parahaemolyticus]EIC5076724.1 LacI family DNA-binding transcriptional regulator [Vibrio parahaemolyticus]ELZ1717989.1 LacI family DNA-binding transcriptional regulator [Vibrio parahaemolyticus]MCC3850065.1 LacI family DNA-binding transcriptional regulator [Vibr
MRLSDLAKLAGVSKTTASYILSGKGEQYRISIPKQNKVWALAEQHNYRPHIAARALRGGRSQLVGVVLPNLQHSKAMECLARIEKLSRELGYRLLISCSESANTCAEELYRDMLLQVDTAVLITQNRNELGLQIDVQYPRADIQTIKLMEATIRDEQK